METIENDKIINLLRNLIAFRITPGWPKYLESEALNFQNKKLYENLSKVFEIIQKTILNKKLKHCEGKY